MMENIQTVLNLLIAAVLLWTAFTVCQITTANKEFLKLSIEETKLKIQLLQEYE